MALIALLSAPLAADHHTRDGIPTRQARETPLFIAYWENDWFGGTDKHYTNGVKLAWISPDMSEWLEDGWRQRLVKRLPFVNRAGTQKNLGVSFAQHIYTPRDTDRTIPDPNDRPYAGWSYLGFSFLAKTDTQADTIALQLGIVGPHSFAGDVQNYVHELLNVDTSKGWRYQLPDEPGINLAWERKWRTYARTVTVNNRLGIRTNPFSGKTFQDRAYWGVDFVPHVGTVIGNVRTYANAGAVMRAGYNLPSDFGVNLIRPAGLSNSPIDDLDPRVRGSGYSVYLFGSFDGRAVARDIFLDGSTFRNSPSVDKEPFVADISLGLGVIAGRFQFTYTHTTRTREFETQANSHSDFGSVTATMTF
ncbi:MAG: lipid A deacylase LpxR family protein [Synoicihabitans sp.]